MLVELKGVACNNHRCIIRLAVAGEDHSEAGAQDLVLRSMN